MLFFSATAPYQGQQETGANSSACFIMALFATVRPQLWRFNAERNEARPRSNGSSPSRPYVKFLFVSDGLQCYCKAARPDDKQAKRNDEKSTSLAYTTSTRSLVQGWEAGVAAQPLIEQRLLFFD